MFELHDVWKSEKRAAQKDTWVLSGANVVFPSGHRIGLLGSDSGRNTAVLRMLSGIEEPDRGAIRRVGVPCWPLDFSNFVENKATLTQNANFLAQVYGVNPAEVVRIATSLSGVKTVRGKPMNQYLGPDKRSLTLGLTLAFQFDWYFVDEKLPRLQTAVAPQMEAAISDRMARASVIWSTTKPETLEGFCDAGLLLDQGSLTFYSNFGEAVDAFHLANGTKVAKPNDRKPRKAGRPGRAARRQGAIDTENAG